MTYRILITGSEGFLGKALAQAAIDDGASVIRTSSRPADQTEPGVHQLDITVPEHSRSLVSTHKPDYIVHLAGISNPSMAEVDERAGDIILGGTLNLLQSIVAVRKQFPEYSPRIFYYSSVEVYGDGTPNQPIDESMPHQPLNKYGQLKSQAEAVFLEFAKNNGLHGVVIQHGQTIGIGQKPDFFVPSVVRQIAQIKSEHLKGNIPDEYVIRTGQVTQKRNLIDVRDAARAVIGLMKYSPALEKFIVAGDTSISLQEVVNYLIKASGLPISHQIVDNGRYPGKDRIYSNKKLKQTIDWSPNISLEQTLSDILEHEIKQIDKKPV